MRLPAYYIEEFEKEFTDIALKRGIVPVSIALNEAIAKWVKAEQPRKRYEWNKKGGFSVPKSLAIEFLRAINRVKMPDGKNITAGDAYMNAMASWMGAEAVAEWEAKQGSKDAPPKSAKQERGGNLGVVSGGRRKPKAVPSDSEKGLADRVQAIYRRAKAGQHQDLLDNLVSHLEKVEAMLANRKGPPASAKTGLNKRRKRADQE